MTKTRKKRKYPTVSRQETKVARGSEYDFPPHIAVIPEELWSYNFHEGDALVGFRIVFDRPLGAYDKAPVRPNRGSMFFEKGEDGAGRGWTDNDVSTHLSKYMGFRLAKEDT